MRADLPTGTVTFLFTDVEGSTRLLHELGAEGYAGALAEHRRVIREACAAEGGVEVDTQGDAFFFAFPTAPGALAAASGFTEALAAGPIQVRVGLHTGTPLLTEEGYVGDDVHFAARVASSGHGGQVILSSATASLIEHSLTDLGEHRLKDIEHAVSIFQLGDGSFPPLKTISNTNLPRPASSFLGREAELAEVLARIEAGARLVTLTGPGGTGKTRLALEAALTLVPEYKAGVFWVGLASLRDPALVVETIARVLGAKDELAAHIGEREMLLLLDNLEQVIECAPELSKFLVACPNLTLLVTSRELLRISGEVEYAVPPLAEPEAVSLFCERSQLEPSEEIAELCARLDSLPLAVELAAARTRALTPAQILERLSSRLDLLKGGRDADPRQQTLRATIEWSYDLLSPAEQQLFARLSVFAGGCTLEAAEEVCDADLDTLQSLVEKSLLRFTAHETGSRYWMLETIREYALGRLDETASAQLDVRHAEHFRALAIALDDVQRGANERAVFDRLAAEHDNIRAALACGIRFDPSGTGAPLVASMTRFWWIRGHLAEGRRWYATLLERRADLSQAQLSLVLADDAFSAAEQEQWEEAVTKGSEALAIARELDDPDLIGIALRAVSAPYDEVGRSDDARVALEEALALSRAVGNRFSEAADTYNIGQWALEHGDLDRAHECFSRALEISCELETQEGIASSRLGLGYALRRQGRFEESIVALRLGLADTARLGFPARVLVALLELTMALVELGAPEKAGMLFGAAISIAESLEMPIDQVTAEARISLEAVLGDGLADAQASGRLLSIDEAVECALGSID